MSAAASFSLENLSIAVVSNPKLEGDTLTREVLRTRANVTRVWPAPAQLPEDYDILICDYSEILPQALSWSPGEATSALIVVLPLANQYSLKILCDSSPDAVLQRPIATHMVATTLALARNQFLYFKRLQRKIARLDENLRATRDIERAKHILMKLRDLSEPEAYEWMRRNAMNRRETIASIATAIVDSERVLG